MTIRRIVSQLAEALEVDPVALRLALLFGSAARDRLRRDSDIDVGILPSRDDLSLDDELGLASRLSTAVGRDVDVVRLDTAPTLLRWRVATNHVPLLAHPPSALPRFLAAAASEHADLAPLFEDARRRLSRRLARSRPHTA
jgi:predicted nucleotidyltransferase